MSLLKKFLERTLEWTSSLCFAGLIAVVLLQVFARLFLARSPHWTEEASRFLMLYMVAFAAGLAARDRAYVNVDFLLNMFKGRLRAFVDLCIDLLSIVLMVTIARYGWDNAMVGRIQTSASLSIPMHLVFMAVVLHAVSVAFYTAIHIIDDLAALFGQRRSS